MVERRNTGRGHSHKYFAVCNRRFRKFDELQPLITTKCFSSHCTHIISPLIRSHLINRSWPRKSNLGRLARRERRGYPQWSVRSEQRRHSAQSALALSGGAAFWLALRCSSVADHCGYASSSRLVQTKKSGSHAA